MTVAARIGMFVVLVGAVAGMEGVIAAAWAVECLSITGSGVFGLAADSTVFRWTRFDYPGLTILRPRLVPAP